MGRWGNGVVGKLKGLLKNTLVSPHRTTAPCGLAPQEPKLPRYTALPQLK